MVGDREHLRSTFDSAADLYHRARPCYPSALFDTLIEETGLRPGDRALEVGCATGKATVALAKRGVRVVGIELGPALADEARGNLAPYPNVTIVCADFEDWQPPEPVPFDLVYAATSWHWIDPDVRYHRAWTLLRPDGHLAFWTAAHVFPEGGDPFFREIQPVYDETGEGLPADASRPRPGELPDQRDEVEASGLFELALVRQFDWEVSYDADAYLRLLDTFSNHIAMEPARREHLYTEIRRRLAERPDGRLRRHWGAVLHIARRRSCD